MPAHVEASPRVAGPLGFLFTPTHAQRRIVLAALGGSILSGALAYGGISPDVPRWIGLTVLANAGLAGVLAALHGKTLPAGNAHLLACVVVVALAVVGAVLLVESAVDGLTNRAIPCRDDTALATVVGGAELRQGANPYVSYDELRAWAATCGFPLSGSPLRSGPFAAAQSYPSAAQIAAAANAALRDPALGGIERRLSYPAGAVLAGAGTEIGVVLLTLLAAAAAGSGVLLRTPRGARAVTSLALLAQVAMWTIIDSGHPDGIAIGLTVLAWIVPSSLAGGALMGVASAIKQTSWFLVLPYLATVWVREGRRAAVRAGALMLAVFAVVNVPFVLLSPAAWLSSVIAPLRDGLFPQGDGIVAIVTTHGYPGALLDVLSVLPYVAIVAAVPIAARFDRSFVGIAALVGGLALWLGQRSIAQYFVGIGVLGVALAATNTRAGVGHVTPI